MTEVEGLLTGCVEYRYGRRLQLQSTEDFPDTGDVRCPCTTVLRLLDPVYPTEVKGERVEDPPCPKDPHLHPLSRSQDTFRRLSSLRVPVSPSHGHQRHITLITIRFNLKLERPRLVTCRKISK